MARLAAPCGSPAAPCSVSLPRLCAGQRRGPLARIADAEREEAGDSSGRVPADSGGRHRPCPTPGETARSDIAGPPTGRLRQAETARPQPSTPADRPCGKPKPRSPSFHARRRPREARRSPTAPSFHANHRQPTASRSPRPSFHARRPPAGGKQKSAAQASTPANRPGAPSAPRFRGSYRIPTGFLQDSDTEISRPQGLAP